MMIKKLKNNFSLKLLAFLFRGIYAVADSGRVLDDPVMTQDIYEHTGYSRTLRDIDGTE